MSGKHSTSSSPTSPSSYKFAKFLQKQGMRDRSRSITDAAATSSTSTLNSASSSELATLPKPRRGSKLLRPTPRTPPNMTHSPVDANKNLDEPPVIIEPSTSASTSRIRTRSERPLSSVSDIHPSVSLYSSSSSTRLGDLPTRLSGWFSHTFSSSSTDLSLPSLLSQSNVGSSPRSKGSAILTAAKHGKGHLDKAIRYLLDSDSTPDKCTESIWLLGVQHPGYELQPPPPPPHPTPRRSSIDVRRRHSPPSFRSSTSSNSSSSSPSTPDTSIAISQSQLASSSSMHPGNNWPPAFYADFTSRIWLTYRSQFHPIRDTTLAALDSDNGAAAGYVYGTPPVIKRWNWGGEKGWTSDSGWGCMLRTGQSLLANALLHLHLGREWRRPLYPVHTVDYATYVRILTWFFDAPSPLAPFSVHRMALAGKELGKDVGQWFGPSTAAGAIRTLVNAFPQAGLGVTVASDGVVFQSDVYAASNTNPLEGDRHPRALAWGGSAVLVLIGVRLGLDGFNPVYGDTIKEIYTFPQVVGIAGGRPSSSYYFVGSQADNLFYLDPHHTRSAVPLRPPPPSSSNGWGREASSESDREGSSKDRDRSPVSRSPTTHSRLITYTSSNRTGSSTFSYHSPISPSPLQQQVSTSSTGSTSSQPPSVASSPSLSSQPLPPPSPSSRTRWVAGTGSSPSSPVITHPDLDHREFVTGNSSEAWTDSLVEHYVRSYSGMELKTFHCDRVRKMPLSGLDPSMLIGFLCKDETDWVNFRRRTEELSRKHKTIFSVQDEPPIWPSDSDDNMGLESMSDPDDVDTDANDAADDDAEVENDADVDREGEGEQFFDTRSGGSASTSSGGAERPPRKSEEGDTEDDPTDPITPGPTARTFEVDVQRSLDQNEGVAGPNIANIGSVGKRGVEDEGREIEDEIEDDWVDSVPRPQKSRQQSVLLEASPQAKEKTKKGKKGKKGKEVAGLVAPTLPSVRNQSQQQHYPFPVSQKSMDDVPELLQDGYGSGHEWNPEQTSVVKGKRMHTARARDGGRTQSGGVKGVMPSDDGYW